MGMSLTAPLTVSGSPWVSALRHGVTSVVALLVAALPLATLIAGIGHLVLSYQSWSRDVYVFSHSCAPCGILLVLLGGSGLLGSLRLIAFPRITLHWFWVPIGVNTLFFMALLYGSTHDFRHPFFPAPIEDAETHIRHLLNRQSADTVATAIQQGGFACHEGPLLGASHFAYNGATVPFSMMCVWESSGPVIENQLLSRPGVLYMHVSPNRQQAWFTATTLAAASSTKSMWVRHYWTGRPLVHHEVISTGKVPEALSVAADTRLPAANPYDFTLPGKARVAINVRYDAVAELEVDLSDVTTLASMWKSNNYVDKSRSFHFTNFSDKPLSLRLQVRHKRGVSNPALPWHPSQAVIHSSEGYRMVFGYDDEGLNEKHPAQDSDFDDVIVDVSVGQGSPPTGEVMISPRPFPKS